MSFIGDFLGKGAGKKAAAASRQAAGVAAEGQTEALNYLKERDQLPRNVSEKALTGLSDYYDNPKSQDQLIAEAKSSPLYAAILGSRKQGEDSILRNASATGGLRSGNVQDDIFSYTSNLENTALLQSLQDNDMRERLRLSGLEGLAGIQGYGNQIAGTISDIGMTKAQGITAGAQAEQQGNQNVIDNILGIGKVAATAFCDLRLKTNIRFNGYQNGHAIYTWDWIPESIKLGLSGSSEGVLAHQVYETHPEAVGISYGFLTVSYDKLGLREAA